MTIGEVAELLGCADQTVRNLAKRGQLEAITEIVATNKSWKITTASVMRFLAEQARTNKQNEQQARAALTAAQSTAAVTDLEDLLAEYSENDTDGTEDIRATETAEVGVGRTGAAAADRLAQLLQEERADRRRAEDVLARKLQEERSGRLRAEALLAEAQGEVRELTGKVATYEAYTTLRAEAAEEVQHAYDAGLAAQQHMSKALAAERKAGEQLLHNYTVPAP
jgi:excisionase family DNA binding protein